MEEKQKNEIWLNVLLVVMVLGCLSLAIGHMMDWSMHLGKRLFAFAGRVLERIAI